VVRAELVLSTRGLGVLVGAFYLASGLVMPLAGRLVDRRGPTVGTLIGLAIAGTGAACYASTHVMSLALVGAALLGGGFAMMAPAYGKLAASELSPSRFPLGMAFLYLGLGGFVVLGGLLGGAMAADDGWRKALWVFAGSAPALCALTWWARARSAPAGQVHSVTTTLNARAADDAGSLFSNKTVRIACIAAVVVSGIGMSFGALWNEFLARTVWGLDLDQRAIVTTAFRLALMVGAPTLALVALSTGPIPLLRWTTAIVAAGVAIWGLSPVELSLTGALVVVVLMGVGASGMPIVVATAVQAVPANRAGSCVGLVQACGMIGSFALMSLPTLLTLVPDLSVAGRGVIGGAAVAAIAAIAHILTWRVRSSRPQHIQR